MSNKKRISKKIDGIERKKALKNFKLGCLIMVNAINRAIDIKRRLIQQSKAYPPGGFIPNNGEREKVIDFEGKEKIIPKYKLQQL